MNLQSKHSIFHSDLHAHADPVEANKQLSQRLYELHNVYKISLELTAALSKKDLLFGYIINIIGLLRAAGAILLLEENKDSTNLIPAISRGYPENKVKSLRFNKEQLEQKQPGEINNVLSIDAKATKSLFAKKHKQVRELGIELIAPLHHVKKLIGIILVGAQVTGEPYSVLKTELLALVNNLFVNVLANARMIETLEQLSTTDGLTGLLNRRAFDDHFQKEIERSQRYHTEFSLALIDIDYFKRYNDINGHPAGDQLLRAFAKLIQHCVRATDIVARYGGEEFAVLLVGVDIDGCNAFCKRFQKELKHFPFKNAARQPKGFISASFGTASFPDDADTAATLLKAADKALYKAKNSGRDTVCSYGTS